MESVPSKSLRALLGGVGVAVPALLIACANPPTGDITTVNEVDKTETTTQVARPVEEPIGELDHDQKISDERVLNEAEELRRQSAARESLDQAYTPFIAQPSTPLLVGDGIAAYTYDTSNGTTSDGDVYRHRGGAVASVRANEPVALSASRYEARSLTVATSPPPLPPSTGGIAPVNGQTHDAMFFQHTGVNPFVDADIDPLLTFGLDVDTASYAMARRHLAEGTMPPEASVRVEDFLNHFDWPMAAPGDDAFAIQVDGAPSPFGEGPYHLLRIGIAGLEIDDDERPDANLTFVIDTSGSMGRENRLELVKRSLRLLVEKLRPTDEIAIVEYGSQARVIMPHHPVGDTEHILKAIDCLQTNGSTNAEAGLRVGYDLAAQRFDSRDINRVILCTDGVANVGETGAGGILEKIRNDADRGIMLTCLGFGMDNYNDVMLEKLSNEGDGIYAYIDDLEEARRVLADNVTGALMTIAREVRSQIEFNPEVVRSYRLLGYENRDIADERFRDDTVDAGEINAGHRVTVLVEVRLWDEVEEGNLGIVNLRYGHPTREEFEEIAHPIMVEDLAPNFESAAPDFRLAACVAEMAEVLRGSHWAQDRDLNDVLPVARGAIADLQTNDTEMLEFLTLLAQARDLQERDLEPGTGG